MQQYKIRTSDCTSIESEESFRALEHVYISELNIELYSKDIVQVYQGAEARISRCIFLGREALVKERFKKKYRLPELDDQLTKERIKTELKAILRCQEICISVPSVYFVDYERKWIIFEYIINSITAKQYLDIFVRKFSQSSDFQAILRLFGFRYGELLAKMHMSDLVHGDLTTSNLLIRLSKDTQELDKTSIEALLEKTNILEQVEFVLIDFGLSYFTSNAEQKAVDLYVLERAIRSSHINSLMDYILEGYIHNEGHASEQQESSKRLVINKFKEVRMRGRKREMIG